MWQTLAKSGIKDACASHPGPGDCPSPRWTCPSAAGRLARPARRQTISIGLSRIVNTMGFISALSLALSFGTLVVPVRGGVKYPDCANGPLKSNLVCDSSANPEARAAALVAAMSNSEKLANLIKCACLARLAASIRLGAIADTPCCPQQLPRHLPPRPQRLPVVE